MKRTNLSIARPVDRRVPTNIQPVPATQPEPSKQKRKKHLTKSQAQKLRRQKEWVANLQQHARAALRDLKTDLDAIQWKADWRSEIPLAQVAFTLMNHADRHGLRAEQKRQRTKGFTTFRQRGEYAFKLAMQAGKSWEDANEASEKVQKQASKKFHSLLALREWQELHVLLRKYGADHHDNVTIELVAMLHRRQGVPPEDGLIFDYDERRWNRLEIFRYVTGATHAAAGRKGGKVRWQDISAKKRSKIMTKVSHARYA